MLIDSAWERRIQLDGRGLLFVPSVFIWPRVAVIDNEPWQPTVIYAARGAAELWDPAPAAADALAALIGSRRASILAALDAPCTTQDLGYRLGLLPGSLSVHLDGESERLPVYRAAVADGRLPAGCAADDGAALVFAGTHLAECVASTPDARVVRISADGSGGIHERQLPIRLLPDNRRFSRGRAELSYGVAELRALRVGRRRWD